MARGPPPIIETTTPDAKSRQMTARFALARGKQEARDDRYAEHKHTTPNKA